MWKILSQKVRAEATTFSVFPCLVCRNKKVSRKKFGPLPCSQAQAEMSAAATGAATGEKPHAVCLPFPAQGHITPMLKLATILHARGFHVTFVNTEYNHRRLVRSRGAAAVSGLRDFRFATIPDGLPPSDADATQDPAAISNATRHHCPPTLGACSPGSAPWPASWRLSLIHI